MAKDKEHKEVMKQAAPQGLSKESMAHHEKIMAELNKVGFTPNPQRKASLTPQGRKELTQFCPVPFCHA